MTSIQKILFEKYQEKTLAQFYLILSDYEKLDTVSWSLNLKKQITKNADHSDFFIIDKDSNESDFKTDSEFLLKLNQIIQFRPLQLSKNFILLFNTHLFSKSLLHKMLKLLEELPSYICLIFLGDKNFDYLATIKSRAIILNLKENEYPSIAQKINYLELLKDVNCPFSLSKLKKEHSFSPTEEKLIHQIIIEKFLENLIQTNQNEEKDFLKFENALLQLKHFESASNFHNSPTNLMAHFF